MNPKSVELNWKKNTTKRRQKDTPYLCCICCCCFCLSSVLYIMECLKNSTTFPEYVIAFIGFSNLSVLNKFGPTTMAIFCGPILFVFSYCAVSTHMSHNHRKILLFGSTKFAIASAASLLVETCSPM